LLQYRGELLPLKDQGDVLPDLEEARNRGEEMQATVLICGDAMVGGDQRVGMVVRQVLDVSTGTPLDRDATDEGVGMELALVKEKLTVVQRRFWTRAATSWQEVA